MVTEASERQRAAVLTVGYADRTVEDLISLLRSESVDALVDVRLTPVSRRPGLSKRRLGDALRGAGIDYLHLPALGNPRENRESFRRGDAASRDRFRERLTTPPALEAIDMLRGMLGSSRLALLCVEQDPSSCHRELVAQELVDEPRTDLRHL